MKNIRYFFVMLTLVITPLSAMQQLPQVNSFALYKELVHVIERGNDPKGLVDIIETLRNELCDDNAVTKLLINALNGTWLSTIVNGTEETPLTCAARKGLSNVAKILLMAAEDDFFRLITKTNYDVDTVFHVAAFNNHPGIFLLVFSMLNSLHKEKNADALMYLYRPNRYGMTPLHYAAREGNKFIVTMLLNNIGYQDARDLILMPNQRGNTPLHLAALSNSIDVIHSLIKPVDDYQREDVHVLIYETMNNKDQSVWSCSSSAAQRILANITGSKSQIVLTFPPKYNSFSTY